MQLPVGEVVRRESEVVAVQLLLECHNYGACVCRVNRLVGVNIASLTVSYVKSARKAVARVKRRENLNTV